MAGAIDVLRVFRDAYLLDSPLGTAFVDLYYRTSPPLADMIARSPWLGAVVRCALWPMILAARCLVAAPHLTAVCAGMLVWAAVSFRRGRKRV